MQRTVLGNHEKKTTQLEWDGIWTVKNGTLFYASGWHDLTFDPTAPWYIWIEGGSNERCAEKKLNDGSDIDTVEFFTTY